MASLLVIEARNLAMTVQELDMRCDKREMPDPTDSQEVASRWICEMAIVGKHDGMIPQRTEGRLTAQMVKGFAAVALTESRLFAIVAPINDNEPSVWITSPLAALKATGTNIGGLFTKRPKGVEIERDGDWTLALAGVAKVLRSGRNAQARQEQGLVDAIGS